MNPKNLTAPKQRLLSLLAASLITLPMAAHSQEREDLEKLRATVLGLIDTLVKSGVIPRTQADAMMREAQRKANVQLAAVPAPEVGADGKKIIRVPYVPEAVRIQMRDQITAEVLAQTKAGTAGGASVTESGSRLQIEGDLRLRAESLRPAEDNTPARNYNVGGGDLTRAADLYGNPNFDTQQQQNRSRVRARLGFNVAVAEGVSTGLALSTGGLTGPTSTSQTMASGAGQTPGYFNKYSLVVDKAFIRYEPISGLSLSGGRIRNPFVATDLVWADDLNFDGFAAAWKTPTGTLIDSFVTAGWFPLAYTSGPGQVSRRSMMALQAGLNWQLGTKNNRIKLAAALYDFSGVEGIKETTTDKTLVPDYAVRSEYGAGYRQRGNTLFRVNSNVANDTATTWGLASGFRELDLTAVIDIAQFDPMHVILTGDIVRNLSFNRGQMQRRSGSSIQDGSGTGYLAQLQLGAPLVRSKGLWNLTLGYRRLGSDAVVDAFTNSDFGLGGTNHKGFTLGGQYGLAKNTWLAARWMSSDVIDSMVPAVSGSSTPKKFSVDTLQFEINARY
jgi:hypothetical protein